MWYTERMKKSLHFAPDLIPKILSGEKFMTWRFFDEKNLRVGDVVDFFESSTERNVGTAKIVKVTEKPFGELTDDDRRGHELYESDEDMYATFSTYYRTKIEPTTTVKIITFELISSTRGGR